MANPDSYKKIIKNRKRDASKVSAAASESVDRHFIGRLENLAHSWRFIAGWMLLISLIIWVLALQNSALSSYYTQLQPRDGGVYTEGIVGPLTNVNPIYATSRADRAVSRVIFNSLLKYDTNNELVGDIAASIEADDKASTFTVQLRRDIYWHDGEQLKADDVAFTIQTIQNPDARSPLLRSWQGVSVELVDDFTVKFRLPGSFSPFPNLLTFGVIPEHILRDVAPKNLRSQIFNTSSPIGTGPFKLQRVASLEGAKSTSEVQVNLLANEDYYLGKPRLDSFNFAVLEDTARIIELFNDGKLDGAYDVTSSGLEVDANAIENVFKETSGIYLFLKTTNPTIADVGVRTAIKQAINVPTIIRAVNEPVRLIDGPLLPEQLGYVKSPLPAYDTAAAATKLDELGYTLGPDGIRQKDGQPLSFNITSQRDSGYEPVVEALVEAFKVVGIDAAADYRDADTFTDNVLQNHVYSDMLVYGINNGVDPDVYSFWHSSQADENSTIKLNLSEYSSEDADRALEDGRSRVDEETRIQKYADFQKTWAEDIPAVPLYRPTFVYYTQPGIQGPQGDILNSRIDRFRDVHMWTVLQSRESIF